MSRDTLWEPSRQMPTWAALFVSGKFDVEDREGLSLDAALPSHASDTFHWSFKCNAAVTAASSLTVARKGAIPLMRSSTDYNSKTSQGAHFDQQWSHVTSSSRGASSTSEYSHCSFGRSRKEKVRAALLETTLLLIWLCIGAQRSRNPVFLTAQSL